MDLLFLRPGSQVLIGRPAKPPSDAIKATIAAAVAKHDAILEAHLPQMYITGAMTTPGVVLVILTTAGPDDLAAIVDAIKSDLKEHRGFNLLVLPLSRESDLWTNVRQQNCRLR